VVRSSRPVLLALGGVLLLTGCRVTGEWSAEDRGEQFCAALSSFLQDFGGLGTGGGIDDLVDLAPPGPREDLETIRDSARTVQAGGIPSSFDGVLAAADDLQRYAAERC